MSRPLGERQRHVLWALLRHGSWSVGAGWHWDGPGLTAAILDSLVRRDLVEVAMVEHPHGGSVARYTLTPAGRMLAGTK